MTNETQGSGFGLNVPYGWWPAASLAKSFEAVGFEWIQVPSPPASILSNPRLCADHARSVATALDTTRLKAVIHAPSPLTAGNPAGDRAFEGLLSYAAEAGAAVIVYHAHNFENAAGSEDLLLAETRSLSRHADLAERLGVTIAIENLAPFYPGPERLGHSPMVLRSLAGRISSPALGLCVDLGHAHIVAEAKHTGLTDLIDPVLDHCVLIHAHDNLGARLDGAHHPELDPLRLDLHLPPGRGSLPWDTVAPVLRNWKIPIILEIHPPHRPHPAVLFGLINQSLRPGKVSASI